jgi:hypothetical protein
MKKTGLMLSAVCLALLLGAPAAHAGGWHGSGHGNWGGHGRWYGYPYYGHVSNDAAIVAAALFGTAALVGAFNAPRYYAPPSAYYPPPPAYYPPPPPAYYPPPPPAYYPPPPPPPYYYPRRGYYYRPY